VWWFRITLLYTKGHPIFKSSLKKAKLQGRYGNLPYVFCLSLANTIDT